MRRVVLLFLSLAVIACGVAPATASAAGPPPDVNIPMFPVKSMTAIPAGFTINPTRALAIAKTAPKLDAIHRAHHPLHYLVNVLVRSHYEVYFYFHGKLIADQIVGAAGQLGPTYTGALIPGLYARGGYAPPFDSLWVLIPFSLMFLLPLVLLRGRSWLDRVDIGVLLTFGISYELFDHAHLEPAVWAFYPPLVYLLVRMLIRGARARPFGPPLGCRLPTAVLVIGLLAMIAARIFISLAPPAVLDVGTASALGAFKILHGQSIYYFSLGHGDTYGPIAYLAYVPFEAIWSGSWAYLPAARAGALTWDLLTMAGLLLLGYRLRGGRHGWRLGLLMAWLWAACPWSLLVVDKSSNDGLVALVVVLIMLSLTSPLRRGVIVGLGFASKFFPAVLLPLVAVGRGNADSSTIRKVLAGFVIAAGASFAIFMPSGGLQEVWSHTIGYQLTRSDVFSIWALHPTLAPIKVALEGFAVILSVAVAFRPRGARTPAQVAALGAAVIVAVQLPALHWFYLYIPWFLPLLLVAVLGESPVVAGPGVVDRPAELESDVSPAVLAGAA
jgi:Glycosyltransferase family 87